MAPPVNACKERKVQFSITSGSTRLWVIKKRIKETNEIDNALSRKLINFFRDIYTGRNFVKFLKNFTPLDY
jgi:hypothetical protein